MRQYVVQETSAEYRSGVVNFKTKQRGLNMKSEVIKITPSLAEHFLSKNVLNRNISHALVAKYASDMENGDWELTHQGIAFYDDGSVADGQHRLLSIIKSGVTIFMMVTHGLKKETSLGIDVHRPRSISDAIKIGGFSDWIDGKHIAIANLIADRKLTSTETIDLLNKMEGSIKFATTHLTSKRFLTNSSSYGAVALAHHNFVDPVILERFCKVFISGFSENKLDTSVIKLRDEFLRSPSNSREIKVEKLLKCQRVILALLKNDPINRVVAPKELIWNLY